MVTLSALISSLDQELRREGYKESTMCWYRGCWRRMQRFFDSQGVATFSLDMAMAWVDSACEFFAKEQSCTLKQTDVYLFRVAQMLEEFRAHGAVLRRYTRRADKTTAQQAERLAQFRTWLRAQGLSVSTIRAYGTLAGEFIAFVDTRGRLEDCDASTLDGFVSTLVGYQFKTVEQKLCAVRSFLRFASQQSWVDTGLLELVPAVKSSKHTRVPSVWDAADLPEWN